jgi:hypothetical protein
MEVPLLEDPIVKSSVRFEEHRAGESPIPQAMSRAMLLGLTRCTVLPCQLPSINFGLISPPKLTRAAKFSQNAIFNVIDDTKDKDAEVRSFAILSQAAERCTKYGGSRGKQGWDIVSSDY